MSAADFTTAYPQQCTTEQTAFRTAIIARERASRVSQADAEEQAGMEIEDARGNFRDRFEPPAAAQTAAAPAPAATPTPASAPATGTTTPAAQPASQTTPPS